MVQYPAFPPTVLLSSVFADGSTWDCRSVSWSLAFLQKVSLNGVTACLDEIHTTMCDWKYHCKSYNNEKIAILVSNVLLAGWGGGESAAVLASRPADAYLCLPGRFTRHRRSTKNWKTYTAEQSDQTVGLLFFRTHSKFYKISKYTEKLQKIACSDVPVFRHIFCGIKILFAIYP